ncbi:ATP-binding protein [Trinickia dabaoshanensis]|uniref:ATP-binding protein n=1 Tax=Trinickia dabaoshanensis TaxID=564714 RepID=A0A2N7VEI0_9BURK|nr:ATP-binding protein [Trinickia dabaoshanensis]PMS15562.1 ATP-binding protein [Trinickia dabaoshanensis]
MFTEIESLLRENPGLKAKVIASKIGKDRSEVNAFLYAQSERFRKDDEHRWYLTRPHELRISLPADTWVNAKLFEDALERGDSPLASPCNSIVIILSKDSKLLLDAMARLLALCNQLARDGKTVFVDCSNAISTHGYFDRVGFFRLLDPRVNVKPSRPQQSRADIYEAGNDGLVEMAMIEPTSPDENIPLRLQECFKKIADSKYWTGIFTVLTELFNNVRDHSQTSIAGFAALQYYRKGRKRHVQAVFSDSGRGIWGTLGPILETKYSPLAKRIRQSGIHEGVALIQEIFREGGISSNDDDGRGLGLKRTADFAHKFNAQITVRQHKYEVEVHYSESGQIEFSSRMDMHELEGTHVCFDFFLDGT